MSGHAHVKPSCDPQVGVIEVNLVSNCPSISIEDGEKLMKCLENKSLQIRNIVKKRWGWGGGTRAGLVDRSKDPEKQVPLGAVEAHRQAHDEQRSRGTKE